MMAIGNIFYEIVSYYIKYFQKINNDGTITILFVEWVIIVYCMLFWGSIPFIYLQKLSYRTREKKLDL